jgi:hypothetical protein
MIGDRASGSLTPYILEEPSAHPPAEGRNSHIPYGLWTCPDGAQALFDRNYVPRWARPADGSPAAPVPLLPCGRGRWVKWQAGGYFFADGEQAFLTHGKGRQRKAERLAIAHGERILADFCSGGPVWRYIAKSDSMPIGFERWQG